MGGTQKRYTGAFTRSSHGASTRTIRAGPQGLACDAILQCLATSLRSFLPEVLRTEVR